MSDYSHLTPLNAPLVRIDWEDIYSSDRWNDDDVIQPAESYQEGHLLELTPAMVVVGSAYSWREKHWGTITAMSLVPPEISVLMTVEEITARDEHRRPVGDPVGGKEAP